MVMPVILNVSLLLFTAFVHLTLSISPPEATWLTIFTVQPEVRGSSLPRLNLSSLCWETSLGKDAHVGKDLGRCRQRFPTWGRAKASRFLDFALFYLHLQICGWPNTQSIPSPSVSRLSSPSLILYILPIHKSCWLLIKFIPQTHLLASTSLAITLVQTTIIY